MVPEQAESVLADCDQFEENSDRATHASIARPRPDARSIPGRDPAETVEPAVLKPPARWSRPLRRLSPSIGGWRALAWFWAAVLVSSVLIAALLQTLGPPRPEMAQRPVSTSRAEPASPRGGEPNPTRTPATTSSTALVGANEPTVLRLPILLARAEVEIAQGRLHSPPGDNATETLAEVYSLLPPGASADRQRADAKMAEVSQRLREATRIPDLDQSQHDAAVPNTQDIPKPARNAAPAPTPTQAVSEQPTRTAPQETPNPNGPALMISVHFAANTPSAQDDARQVAARLGGRFDRVNTQGDTEVPEKAIVRFFSPQDHNTARSVGKMLAEMGYSWRIDNKAKQAVADSPRFIEVLLPPR